jgi:hypothetical protein
MQTLGGDKIPAIVLDNLRKEGDDPVSLYFCLPRSMCGERQPVVNLKEENGQKKQEPQ